MFPQILVRFATILFRFTSDGSDSLFLRTVSLTLVIKWASLTGKTVGELLLNISTFSIKNHHQTVKNEE